MIKTSFQNVNNADALWQRKRLVYRRGRHMVIGKVGKQSQQQKKHDTKGILVEAKKAIKQLCSLLPEERSPLFIGKHNTFPVAFGAS